MYFSFPRPLFFPGSQRSGLRSSSSLHDGTGRSRMPFLRAYDDTCGAMRARDGGMVGDMQGAWYDSFRDELLDFDHQYGDDLRPKPRWQLKSFPTRFKASQRTPRPPNDPPAPCSTCNLSNRLHGALISHTPLHASFLSMFLLPCVIFLSPFVSLLVTSPALPSFSFSVPRLLPSSFTYHDVSPLLSHLYLPFASSLCLPLSLYLSIYLYPSTSLPIYLSRSFSPYSPYYPVEPILDQTSVSFVSFWGDIKKGPRPDERAVSTPAKVPKGQGSPSAPPPAGHRCSGPPTMLVPLAPF